MEILALKEHGSDFSSLQEKCSKKNTKALPEVRFENSKSTIRLYFSMINEEEKRSKLSTSSSLDLLIVGIIPESNLHVWIRGISFQVTDL